MAISDYKITDTTGHKVGDIPGSTLTGEDIQANKDIFDAYANLIKDHFNDLVDYLQNQGIDTLQTWRQNVLKTVYPVGSIYTSTSSASPAGLFGGTWEQIQGRFLLAAGSGYSAGATGGSANATLVAHTHSVSGTAASNGAHTHSLSGTANSNGTHYHTSQTGASFLGVTPTTAGIGELKVASSSSSSNKVPYASASNVDFQGTGNATGGAGAHTHSLSGTANSNGAHTHSISGTAASQGSSATGANMPPYLAVYVWKRIA